MNGDHVRLMVKHWSTIDLMAIIEGDYAEESSL
jgi:hypothetical protein